MNHFLITRILGCFSISYNDLAPWQILVNPAGFPHPKKKKNQRVCPHLGSLSQSTSLKWFMMKKKKKKKKKFKEFALTSGLCPRAPVWSGLWWKKKKKNQRVCPHLGSLSQSTSLKWFMMKKKKKKKKIKEFALTSGLCPRAPVWSGLWWKKKKIIIIINKKIKEFDLTSGLCPRAPVWSGLW